MCLPSSGWALLVAQGPPRVRVAMVSASGQTQFVWLPAPNLEGVSALCDVSVGTNWPHAMEGGGHVDLWTIVIGFVAGV